MLTFIEVLGLVFLWKLCFPDKPEKKKAVPTKLRPLQAMPFLHPPHFYIDIPPVIK